MESTCATTDDEVVVGGDFAGFDDEGFGFVAADDAKREKKNCKV
jgi:hypothetical protein